MQPEASQLLAEVPNQSVARRVRLLLLQSAQPRLELRDVARRLGASDRTLRRQLAAEGTSFREILDSAMRERTLSLLRDRALSLEEVTERAGFTDPSGLYRAVRRWTNLSPVEFRDSRREQAQ